MSIKKQKSLYRIKSITNEVSRMDFIMERSAAYIVGIVGVVAAVGILVAVLNAGAGSSHVSGAATYIEASKVPTTTSWTTCVDNGNMIKLGDKQGGILKKYDVCTGTADKNIAYVSCVMDEDGFYSYKYSNQESCSDGKTCMKDDEGAAYCG